MVSISNSAWYSYYVRGMVKGMAMWPYTWFALPALKSVPGLFKLDTIMNRPLCGSIESLIAMKM